MRAREWIVGIFSRTPILCPACKENLSRSGDLMDHCLEHVYEIPSGAAAGFFTWSCGCGPSDMKWPQDYHAAAGMAVHMRQRHSIGI